MRISRTVYAVDSHTAGEPTRTIIGGVPNVWGKTMPEKKEYLEKHYDYIRTALMLEPRGHNGMFGSILTQPTVAEADFGIVFMHGGGYLNMCGHGLIGAATVAIETGMVSPVEPITEITIESPAGLVKAYVTVENNVAKSVTVKNVPSFLYREEIIIDVPGLGKVVADISFGGSFFAIVDVKQLGLKVNFEGIDQLIKAGIAIKDAANKQISVRHPALPHINSIELVEFYDDPTLLEADFKNVVIFGKGQFDRSPCGTGTSAKMATLYAKGQLGLNQKFVYQSIIGTIFQGRLVEEIEVCGLKAVVPEITGSAFITGFSQYVISPDDPLKHGFSTISNKHKECS
jgi:proline racemase